MFCYELMLLQWYESDTSHLSENTNMYYNNLASEKIVRLYLSQVFFTIRSMISIAVLLICR